MRENTGLYKMAAERALDTRILKDMNAETKVSLAKRCTMAAACCSQGYSSSRNSLHEERKSAVLMLAGLPVRLLTFSSIAPVNCIENGFPLLVTALFRLCSSRGVRTVDQPAVPIHVSTSGEEKGIEMTLLSKVTLDHMHDGKMVYSKPDGTLVYADCGSYMECQSEPGTIDAMLKQYLLLLRYFFMLLNSACIHAPRNLLKGEKLLLWTSRAG